MAFHINDNLYTWNVYFTFTFLSIIKLYNTPMPDILVKIYSPVRTDIFAVILFA